MDKARSWLIGILSIAACSAGGGSRPLDAGSDSRGSLFVLPDSGGCRTGSPSPASPGNGSDPLCTPDLPSVSYTADVAPILAGCTGEVCHAPWSYQTLVGQKSIACCDHRWLVEPGQPSASHMIQAVRGVGACVSQMPQDEGSLAADDIKTLIAWVCEGAPDD